MSDFEFLFVLFSLVMGLSLVELLTGLARALEIKLHDGQSAQTLAFGWLTPLLAVFVILDLLSFWMFSWAIRDLVSVTRFSTLAVVAFSSAYFLAARLVFPSEPEAYHDLDTHYLQVRRTIFAMLGLMVLIQWVFVLWHPALRALAGQPMTVTMTILLLALMAAAMGIRSKRWSSAILVVLVLRYLVIYAL